MSTGHLATRLQAAIGDRPLELVNCDDCHRIDDVEGDASLIVIPRPAGLDLARAIVDRRWDDDVVQHLHQFTISRLQKDRGWWTPQLRFATHAGRVTWTPQLGVAPHTGQVTELRCALLPAILIRVPAQASMGVWLDLWAAIVDVEINAYRAMYHTSPAKAAP